MNDSEILEKRIDDFKERYPNKQFHIDEKGNLVKGPIYHRYCQLCGKNIEDIRDNNPRRRIVKFCSDKCRIEYDRRKDLQHVLSADMVIWTTYKGEKYPKRNTMFAVYHRKGKDPIQIPVIGRKGNFLIVQV